MAALVALSVVAFISILHPIVRPSSSGSIPSGTCTTSGHQSSCVLQEAHSSGITIHNVTLQHQQNFLTAVPVNFTFTYPVSDPAIRMPLLMLFNGASVESFWYRRLSAQLACKGYVVVTNDYYRPYTVPIPNLPSDARTAFASCGSGLSFVQHYL